MTSPATNYLTAQSPLHLSKKEGEREKKSWKRDWWAASKQAKMRKNDERGDRVTPKDESVLLNNKIIHRRVLHFGDKERGWARFFTLLSRSISRSRPYTYTLHGRISTLTFFPSVSEPRLGVSSRRSDPRIITKSKGPKREKK